MNTTNSNERIIRTGMFSPKAYEVISSVLGQLSDGWGENKPMYDKYWMFARVRQDEDGEVIIAVKRENYTRYCDRYIDNGFAHMDDEGIKSYFARLIKKTARMEMSDCGQNSTSGWNRNNTRMETVYLNYHEKITIAEVYAIYEKLLGRRTAGKYSSSLIESAISHKKTEAEIKYEADLAALNKAEAEELAALKAKYEKARKDLANEYNNQKN